MRIVKRFVLNPLYATRHVTWKGENPAHGCLVPFREKSFLVECRS
jgi:hypothetical protein